MMWYLKSLDEPYLILGLIVPGLIALFVRSQFITGRRIPHSENLLSYLTVSIIYYALILPLVDLTLPQAAESWLIVIAWLAIVFAGPAMVGLFLGVNIQKDLCRRALQKLGLNPVHVMPTAWDWKFARMSQQWMLVTLNDGTRYAGFFGSDSFASSEPGKHDLYIQWPYEIGENDEWTQCGESGVLITSGNIRTIDFWPYNPKEDE